MLLFKSATLVQLEPWVGYDLTGSDDPLQLLIHARPPITAPSQVLHMYNPWGNFPAAFLLRQQLSLPGAHLLHSTVLEG